MFQINSIFGSRGYIVGSICDACELYDDIPNTYTICDGYERHYRKIKYQDKIKKRAIQYQFLLLKPLIPQISQKLTILNLQYFNTYTMDLLEIYKKCRLLGPLLVE